MPELQCWGQLLKLRNNKHLILYLLALTLTVHACLLDETVVVVGPIDVFVEGVEAEARRGLFDSRDGQSHADVVRRVQRDALNMLTSAEEEELLRPWFREWEIGTSVPICPILDQVESSLWYYVR